MKKLIGMMITAAFFSLMTTGNLMAEDGTPLTFWVKCGSQGILDADWEVSVEILDSDCKPVFEEPVTVDLARGTRAKAAAQRLAKMINLGMGQNIATAQQTDPKSYMGKKSGAKTLHDICLASGYKFGKIEVTIVNDKDNGHLEVRPNKKKGKKKRKHADDWDRALSWSRPFQNVDVIPVQDNPSFDMVIGVFDIYTMMLGVEVYFTITDPDPANDPIPVSMELYYDGAVPIDLVLNDMAMWFMEQGAEVTFIDPNQFGVSFENSGIPVEEMGVSLWHQELPDGVFPPPNQYIIYEMH